MVARALFLLSLLYLALPYCLFFAGWLSLPWALLAILLLLITGVLAARQAWQAGESAAFPRITLTRATAVAYVLLALLLAFLSGAGGYGFQTHDWIKHEALLHDLITRPWPVIYAYYTQPVALVYYVAHYLPAAWIGKFDGSGVAHAVLFGWTVLGLLLTFAWFSLLARSAAIQTLLVLLIFGGLDWIGLLLRHQFGWGVMEVENWREIEDWTDLVLQFDAPVNTLFWAPQHALAGWLAGAMIAYLLLHPLPRLQLVPLALTPFWSPFVTIGLLPLLTVNLFASPQSWRQRLRDLVSIPNLASIALLACMGVYFSARLGQISPLLVSDLPHGWLPVSLEIAMGLPQRLGEWVLFLVLEVVLWGVVIGLARTGSSSAMRDVRALWGSVLLGLVLVSLYGVGLNNDLGLRASIPLIFLLAAMTARSLTDPLVKPARRWPVLVMLILGGVTPLTAYVRQIAPLVTSNSPWQTADVVASDGIQTLYADDEIRFSQYVGDVSAPFFANLGRPLILAPDLAAQNYVSFGDKILFASYELQPVTAVAPGTTVDLVLELHVFTRVITENYNLQVRLVNAAGQVIWQEQGWPQNRPTSIPAEEIIWFDTRKIPLPNDLPPALYRLEMGIVNVNPTETDGGDLLPAQWLPGGAPLGELPVIGYVQVGNPTPAPITPLSPAAQFGDVVTLAGAAHATQTPIAPGTTVTITLQWATDALPKHDLTGFVHLLDAQGALVAQWDQPPLGGFLPMRVWQPGLRVDDRYPLTIPEDTLPGRYRLVAGLYDAATGQRLPVVQEGAPPRDFVELGALEVDR